MAIRAVAEPDAATMARAERVVRAHLVRTPVVRAPLLGDDIVLKLETLQPTGSFKVRGGLAAVASALRDDRDATLIAASAGNHGLGLAFAAGRLGAVATVVVPTTASTAKVKGLERFEVRVVHHGETYDDAERHAVALAADGELRFVSPYNDPDVIAGQATVGVELLQQIPDLATVIVPVGGGGLLSGVGLATAGVSVRVVGVEPERSAAMSAAMGTGHQVTIDAKETLADGLAGNIEAGSVTIDLARRFTDTMLTVSEAEIAAAVRFLAFEHGVVAEGSGAVPVAAILSGRLTLSASPTALVITGRNIDRRTLVALLVGEGTEPR